MCEWNHIFHLPFISWNWTIPQLELVFSFFHKKSAGYFVRYHYEDTEGLFCLFSNSWHFTLNEAYLDIKEIYGILKEQENSEYFKSLKPERALDGLDPMLFFSLD